MFETRLSNFHKMTLIVLKSSLAKQKPRLLNYRNYKSFNNNLFRDQVLNKLRNSNLQISENKVKTKRKFIKCRSKKAYNKHRNKCVSLLKDNQKAYYSNLSVKDIVDNKTFCKTVKSFFFDKSNNFENITLIENGNLLTDDFKIAETNKYFLKVVPNLDLQVPSKLLYQTPENGDEILSAIYKYKNHPSIKTILEKCNSSFFFKTLSLTDIEKERKSLNTNKASDDDNGIMDGWRIF